MGEPFVETNSTGDFDQDLVSRRHCEQAKAEFLAGISRVVHSAMNSVVGMLDIALDERISEKVKDCLATARSSANALVAMINDIVDITSIETGQIHIQPRHCTLAEVLTDISNLLNAQMALRGRVFDLTLDRPVPAAVYTDPVRLRQCLLDIVNSTVAELNCDDIAISLSSASDLDDCWIRFDLRHCRTRDGSDEEHSQCRSYWERVKAIVAMDPHRPSHARGADLGLLIAHQLSRLLGGRLSLESGPDEPIHLSLVVPSGMGADPRDMLTELPEQIRPKQVVYQPISGRVLVADDDRIDRKVVQVALQKFGLDVTVVNGGQAVLDRVAAETFDLLVVDMLMPDLDGCEVVRRLRERGLTVPIVALTGNVMKPEIDACLAAGYNEHLPKPVNREQLAGVLERHLALASVVA